MGHVKITVDCDGLGQNLEVEQQIGERTMGSDHRVLIDQALKDAVDTVRRAYRIT